MSRFVLLSLTVALFFGTSLSTAQEAPKAEVTISHDSDGDGIDDELDACPTDFGPADPNPKKNGCTARALARAWVLDFLVKYSPPGHKTYFKEAEETKEEALVRYNGIARDLVNVVYDPNVRPLFAGPAGRSQTVSLLLGVMFWETSLRKDVDYGIGAHSRGDHGRSWCLMQINIGDGKTPSGISGEELVRDRRECFLEGIRVIRGSFSVCHELPFDERLSAYASGSCERGHDKSKQRVRTGMQWFNRSPRVFKDEEAMAEEDEPHNVSPPNMPLLARTG
jgi:hypothetical protein